MLGSGCFDVSQKFRLQLRFVWTPNACHMMGFWARLKGFLPWLYTDIYIYIYMHIYIYIYVYNMHICTYDFWGPSARQIG